jgi:hypothetical protein
MRGLTLPILALLAASATTPAVADPSAFDSADHAGVEQTIRGQMDAFQHDDATGAFSFAAPDTQQRFGDAQTFLDMVRRAYQPVYHPRDVDFSGLTNQDGAIVQRVELIGPDGAPYTALYTMEREPDGTWKIIACMLVPSQRVGA